MAETEMDRLERSVSSLATSVSTLTKDVAVTAQGVSANREDISKLHEALKLVSTDVEKHGLALYRIELEAAKEEGRKQATGDLQAKLRDHDDAAREVKALRLALKEQGDTVDKLKQAHDQQRGILIAVSVVAPIFISLLTAYIAKVMGLG